MTVSPFFKFSPEGQSSEVGGVLKSLSDEYRPNRLEPHGFVQGSSQLLQLVKVSWLDSFIACTSIDGS